MTSSTTSSSSSAVSFPELAALEAAERVLSQTHANNCAARDELVRAHRVSAEQVESKREELEKLEVALSAAVASMDSARARAKEDGDKLTKLRATIASAKQKLSDFTLELRKVLEKGEYAPPPPAAAPPATLNPKKAKVEEEEEDHHAKKAFDEASSEDEDRVAHRVRMTEAEKELYATEATYDDEWDSRSHAEGDVNTLGLLLEPADFIQISRRMQAIMSNPDNAVVLDKKKFPKNALDLSVHPSRVVRPAQGKIKKQKCVMCGCGFKEGWLYVPTCHTHVVHLACMLAMDNVFRRSPSRYFHDCPDKLTFATNECSSKS